MYGERAMSNVIENQPFPRSLFGPVKVDRGTPWGPFEQFVDEHVVASFLHISPRRVLEMARKRLIPAHPLGLKRKTWRFRISEIDTHFSIRGEKQGPGIIVSAVPGTHERKRIG